LGGGRVRQDDVAATGRTDDAAREILPARVEIAGEVYGDVVAWPYDPFAGGQVEYAAGRVEKSGHGEAALRHPRIFRQGIRVKERARAVLRKDQLDAGDALPADIFAAPLAAHRVLRGCGGGCGGRPLKGAPRPAELLFLRGCGRPPAGASRSQVGHD